MKTMNPYRIISLAFSLTLTGSAMAQVLVNPPATSDSQLPPDGEPGQPPRHQHCTYEQMTEKMVADLKLDEKQAKKVAKLNKNTVLISL